MTSLTKTIVLIAFLVIFATSESYLAEEKLMFPVLGISLVLGFVWYFFSGNLVLIILNAKKIRREDDAKLYEILDNLSKKKIDLYITHQAKPQSYSFPGAIVISFPLRSAFTKDELEGIMATEIFHQTNFNARLYALAFIFKIFPPFYHLLISPKMDFEADLWAAKQTQDPESLATALEKLNANSKRITALRNL